MIHISGVKRRAVDCVSRYPSGELNLDRLHLIDDVCGVSTDNLTLPTFSETMDHFLTGIRQDRSSTLTESVDILVASATPPAITWDRVCLSTTTDPDMHYLTTIIPDNQKWQKDHLPHQIQAYYAFRHHLSTTDGVVLYKDRIVLPPSLRPDCLKALHAAHQSTSSMIAKAELSTGPASQMPMPLHVTTAHIATAWHRHNQMLPQCPQHSLSIHFNVFDYLHYKGIKYLPILDRYSNWPIVERAQDCSHGLINCLCCYFVTLGISDEFSSDVGPEFVAAARYQFLKTLGVH